MNMVGKSDDMIIMAEPTSSTAHPSSSTTPAKVANHVDESTKNPTPLPPTQIQDKTSSTAHTSSSTTPAKVPNHVDESTKNPTPLPPTQLQGQNGPCAQVQQPSSGSTSTPNQPANSITLSQNPNTGNKSLEAMRVQPPNSAVDRSLLN